MEGTLTVACFAGTPNLWVVGQKCQKNGIKYLTDAYIQVAANGQMGLAFFPGAKAHTEIQLDGAMFYYTATNDELIARYVQETTGIMPVVTPPLVSKPNNVLPFGGGPRPN